jgi:MHS family proline/betaine transporter-like MFS transporter
LRAVSTVDAGVPAHVKRNTIGGVVGNVLEWYDFAIFGYFAPIIGAQFFPAENQVAALINAFGVFAAGYMMRPLGGLVFGHLGDRLGRKRALQLSVLLMAIPTTLLGLLPTYASIGIGAPIALVALRLLQGVSVGGELIGSISFITEIAPANRRGLYGSWTLFSAVGGIMVGSFLATVMHTVFDPATLSAWGWRLPFLAGFAIGGFGLWMREGMVESPDFEKLEEAGGVAERPVSEALRRHPGRIFHIGALVVMQGGGFYMLFVWWPTYLSHLVQPAVSHALLVNTISMGLLVVLVPLAGLASDLWGRKPVLAAGLGGFVLLAYPLFVVTDHGLLLPALGAQLVFAVLMAATLGPAPATMVEMFPTRTRFSGIAIGYNVSLALFGGTAPLVCTWLISRTGDVAAPAYYLIAMGVISLTAVLMLRPASGEASQHSGQRP